MASGISKEDEVFVQRMRDCERQYIDLGLRLRALQESAIEVRGHIKLVSEMWEAKGAELEQMRKSNTAQLDLFPDFAEPKMPDLPPVKNLDSLRTSNFIPQDHLPPAKWEPMKTDAHHWRAASVEELDLVSIEGLGRRKMVLLIQTVPTIGHLEDLRLAAMREYRHICELLPKGFGPAVGDILTERLLSWLTMNRDLPRRESAEQSAVTPESDAASPLMDAETNELADIFAAIDLPDLDKKPSSSVDLSERFRYYLNTEIDLAGFAESQDFQFGFNSGSNGDSYSFCPFNEPGMRQDMWLAGYAFATKGGELP